VLGPFLDVSDILGHEPMGVVEQVGPEVAARCGRIRRC
jgi:threonine dehydrogenase-like Zn-dependent dehydrogenase